MEKTNGSKIRFSAAHGREKFMRALISVILTGVILVAVSVTGAHAPSAFAQGRTRTTGGAAQSSRVNNSSVAPARICKVSGLAMPGADVGAKINACDAALGAGGSPAEIQVDTGGTISTYVKVSRGRTLWFRKGTYTLHQAFTGNPAQDIQTELGMIRYADDVTIKGDGWETVLVEPPLTHRPTVFAPYISSVLTNGGYFHDPRLADQGSTESRFQRDVFNHRDRQLA
jgi:hypothetical protein